MKLWKKIRTAVFASAFAGAMIASAVQATASSQIASSVPDAAPASEAPAAEPQAPSIVPEDAEGASCTQWACRTECAPFGGHLVAGGPGKPLQCACCG